jgi:excisionase family DNA binding protein
MANRQILSVSELAEHLNVHAVTIYRWLRSGDLPGFKVGRVWRFDLDLVTGWMDGGRFSTVVDQTGDR